MDHEDEIARKKEIHETNRAAISSKKMVKNMYSICKANGLRFPDAEEIVTEDLENLIRKYQPK
jgi:hypothetical protein